MAVRPHGLILVALVALLCWQPAHAKKSTIPRIIFTDATDVQVDARNVKVVYLQRVFGESKPKRKVLTELPGLRGKGVLSVDLESIRMFTVREASFRGATIEMRLRDGEELEYEVTWGRGDIVFEGRTSVGAYAVSLKNLKAAVLEFESL